MLNKGRMTHITNREGASHKVTAEGSNVGYVVLGITSPL